MARKKGNTATKKAAAVKAAAKTTATKKPPFPKKGGGGKSTSGSNASPADLPSPTDSVGPTWDSPLRSLPDAVKAILDTGPIPRLSTTPIHFINPLNYCYRNALMTMMMYTPQLLAYVRHWHMQMEFPDHPYLDHIMQAFDNVAQAYHTPSSTRARDTEAAMFAFWKLFRGAPSSVASFLGALPEPDKALQEDSSELLDLVLNETERQLNEGGMYDDGDQSKSIFQAMLKMSVTYRSRCPGTQDGICTNPNEKQRRPLEENYIFNVRIPTGEDHTLRNCIADTLRDRDQRWCAECSAQLRHANPDTINRDDRAWRHIRDCPEVLFMRLQRFRQVPTKTGVRDEKITAPVKIPETLDLSEFLEYHSYGEGSVVQYELRGVVSHIGTLKGGHYVAHVKEGKNWWRVDDQGNPTVTASSMERMNSDSGGKTGKSAKFRNHPFLLSWVKVKEEIVAPTKAAVKTPTKPPSKEGKEPNDGTQTEKNEGAGDEEKPGAGISRGQGAEDGNGEAAIPKPRIKSTLHENEHSDEPESPAEEGKCKIWVILNLGDEEKTIAFKRQKANVSLDCSKDFSFSGDVRIVDDKGNLFTWEFANPQGLALHDAVRTGSPKIPRKPKPATIAAPATKQIAGTKRKEPEPEDETYVDPADDTYIDPGNSKKAKTGAKGSAPKAVVKSPPRPVRKGGRLMRGPKPGKPASGDEDEESPPRRSGSRK